MHPVAEPAPTVRPTRHRRRTWGLIWTLIVSIVQACGPDRHQRAQPRYGRRLARWSTRLIRDTYDSDEPGPGEGTTQVNVECTSEPVTLDVTDGIMFASLNRPEARNAVNSALSQALGEALDEADRDPQVRVVLLRAAGSAFCAGADLKELAAGESILAPRNPEWGFAGFVRHHVCKPIVCAMQGPAMGGGIEIALASDLVIASEKATMGLPEVTRGIMAAAGGAFRLPAQIPRKIAMEMLLTGQPITARRAQSLGLVNHVVRPEALENEALRLAYSIAANAPLAVQATKRVAKHVMNNRTPDEDESWTLSDAEAATLRSTADAREGATAFIEKRAPRWTAR